MFDEWILLGKIANAGPDVDKVCSALAELFRVNTHEIGLLCLRGSSLEFAHPKELRKAGRIPLSSSAVAARTAKTKTAEVFNEFAKVTHHSVFELVPLGGGLRPSFNPDSIQKLMSAAVVDDQGQVCGVVQISRKGPGLSAAGPDFEETDLKLLERVAPTLVPLFRIL